jgi:hypothetical protein
LLIVQAASLTQQQLHPAWCPLLLPCVSLPGVLFRGMVIAGQAVFFSAFAASYMISPKVSTKTVTVTTCQRSTVEHGHQQQASLTAQQAQCQCTLQLSFSCDSWLAH